MKIPYYKIENHRNEIKYLKDVLSSGWYSTGPKSFELEKKFSEFISVRYALTVSSCTSALHLAFRAIKLKKGDKVIVPTTNFISSFEAIEYCGATPILADVEYGTSNISIISLKNLLKKHASIKAIVVVHFGGQVSSLYSKKNKLFLNEIKKRKIKIIDDAAHAFPSKYNKKFVGNFADITCFSFYANKTITAGEGGMITTNNKKYASRIKLLRLHGIDRDVWTRFTSIKKSKWEYDIVENGYKYNLSDLNSAVCLAHLEKAEIMRKKREKIARFYIKELKDVKAIDLPELNVPMKDHSWHLFIIKINSRTKIIRNELIDLLDNHGIGTSVHYKPIHRMTYYKKNYKFNNDFKNAEMIWKNCISLPIYSLLTMVQLRFIVDKIKFHLK